METLGTYLRQQREQVKLSLETVSICTKIRPSLLQDMEDDCLERLPSGVFLRGFVQAFTKAVGGNPSRALEILDAQQVQTDYSRDYVSPMVNDDEPSGSRFKMVHLVALVFALLTMLGAYFMLSGPPTERATISSAPATTDVTSGTTKSFVPRTNPGP